VCRCEFFDDRLDDELIGARGLIRRIVVVDDDRAVAP
jgi:hypothetical protein